MIHVDLSRRDWPKRVGFALVWLLLLFGDKVADLIVAGVPAAGDSLSIWLRNPRLHWLLALIVVAAAARLKPFALVVQAIYFLLFVPLATAYTLYWLLRVLLRFPRTTHRFLTSPRLHLVLWPLTALSVLATLAGWFPGLGAVYLVTVLVAVTVLVVLAFEFAFLPGALHRGIGSLALGLWGFSKRDIDEKLRSGEFARNPAGLSLKVNEVEQLREWGDRLIAYLETASDRQAAVKMFGIALAVLIGVLVFLFAVAFQAVEWVAPGSFGAGVSVDFLDLLLYSLSTTLTAGLPGVTPLSDLARLVTGFQLICSLAIVVVLLLVLTTFSPGRYQEELGEVVNKLRAARQEVVDTLESVRRLETRAETSVPSGGPTPS